MPTYEYRCKDCGKNLEVVQAFSDDPLTECPACQGPLKKVFQPVGIAFRGSGFYKTDSRSSGSSTRTSSAKSKSSDSSSSSSGSSGSSGSSSDAGGGDSSSTTKEAKTA